ncbi:bifunctional diaminohydroxyphosphoribosylaminopyrimidine deaminase/5-amino-6-(5-phosphoribosylamino)uracil reductase RibD [Pedobacter nutrimenti]|uniref:bifunctional diaminohydroxyphosphoribosylaminopyrimidine deaminase/5-amino-6-(5-phosphoribosylamino)uracil reductase RibD n=1 Tax=Pedobacter nutrimenti TaxID=1241337 RepID=UPI00292D1C1A|nr:bifunctional diaminohydroxyphosphoribosylaminopyrimidine deaminase/5-amino-6-(5-phosphoribosylamino)uracil reductase RibD [Pedobacter nutrimenti]
MRDELYMQRCLELAELGMASVSPNPMVGCVIVNNHKIIGEGYHQKIGQAHAEVNAIRSVLEKYGEQAESLLKEATVYVSLEPCAHFGKTPPCADLLIKHQVKKVVIGNRDPFPDVNGKGISKLENAGIEVIHGVLEEQCRQLNRRFFTRIEKQRPYIILKWAQTANGFFAPLKPSMQWITGALSKKLVHKWRGEEDAILVGKKTVLTDNPELTTRAWHGKNPIRIVIDKNLEIPSDKNIYNDAVKTIIFNELKTDVMNNLHYVQMEDMQYYLPQKIAFQLYLMDVQSVMIEGGANILNQFLSANLWDEARVLTSPVSWESGISAPRINGNLVSVSPINEDQLILYKNTSS